MKRFIYIAILGLSCFLASQTAAAQQENLRERIARRQGQENNSAASQLTERTRIYNEQQTQEIANASWVREIYRFIDMRDSQNAVLYNPVKPNGKTSNLLTLIFNLVLNGDIPVYQYLADDTENFSEEYKMNIDSSFFNKLDIPFRVDNGKYLVDQSSIPSADVKGFYLKETWYFDKNNSVVNVKPVALSPVMIYQSDYAAGLEFDPLFWLPYESIKSYTAKMPIRTSHLNDATNQTINDFFVKRQYKGDIYKTSTLGISVADFENKDSLKVQRTKIENQLKQFNKNLWVYNDSIGAANKAAPKVSTKKGKGNKVSASSSNAKSDAPDRATVQKEAKEQKVKSAPVRSMRNRKN